ncbi:MAG: hypothetical protein RIQ94_1843, partial [Pseudomonadota bacterium]
MTDDELKSLVASLAVAQKVTDEQIASLAVDSKSLHEAQKATDEQIKLNAIAQKTTDEQMRRNDKMLTEKLDRMGITLGNVTNNQGDVA